MITVGVRLRLTWCVPLAWGVEELTMPMLPPAMMVPPPEPVLPGECWIDPDELELLGEEFGERDMWELGDFRFPWIGNGRWWLRPFKAIPLLWGWRCWAEVPLGNNWWWLLGWDWWWGWFWWWCCWCDGFGVVPDGGDPLPLLVGRGDPDTGVTAPPEITSGRTPLMRYREPWWNDRLVEVTTDSGGSPPEPPLSCDKWWVILVLWGEPLLLLILALLFEMEEDGLLPSLSLRFSVSRACSWVAWNRPGGGGPWPFIAMAKCGGRWCRWWEFKLRMLGGDPPRLLPLWWLMGDDLWL